MELNEKEFQAMQRLARSSWGAPAGVGSCKDKALWIDLVHNGYARAVRGDRQDVLALTLHGFRVLEADRMRREIESKPA